MDANRLRRLAEEVDREHREAMSGVFTDLEESLGRRGLVRKLGGFAVMVAGVSVAIPAFTSAAGAQQSSTTTAAGGSGATSGTTVAGVTTTAAAPTTAGAPTTTTTLPPLKPQPTDVVFLSFAQSIELAAVQIYGLALARSIFSDNTALVGRTFQSHHNEHGQAFAGMAGKTATGAANQSLLSAYTPKIQAAATEADLLAVALEVEMALAATYTAALAQILGINPAALTASMQPIEARHAVVLSQALHLDIDTYSPTFEPTAGAVTPDQYPIVER